MGKTDPTFKRLSVFLMVIVFMLFLYACKSILLNEPDSYEGLTETIETQSKTAESFSLFDTLGVIFDFIGFMFGMFFLQLPAIAWYLLIFIIPFYLLLLFVFWYIVVDYVFDIGEVIGDWLPF